MTIQPENDQTCHNYSIYQLIKTKEIYVFIVLVIYQEKHKPLFGF